MQLTRVKAILIFCTAACAH